MACSRYDLLKRLFGSRPKRRQDSTPHSHKTSPALLGMAISEQTRLGLPRLANNQFIRILRLEPGVGDDPLVGTFEPVHIDNAGSYEPISYVWTQATSHRSRYHEISIHQGAFERKLDLTVNLHGALKRLRLPHDKRRLWVDQICIDQESDERGEQVQLMNKIYQNAKHVLAWLGLDEERLAGSAFELIHRLDDALRCREISELSAAYNEELEVLIEKDRKALDKLTALPWFKRGWIVQEIGTMAPATMFWGESEIDWFVLHRVCDNLTKFHHLRSKLNVRTSEIKYMFRRFVEPDPGSYHANRFNFIYELHRARGLQFSDQRDRIFAWLGHYSVRVPNENLAKLEADYRKTVAEVYIDVAERALLGKNDEETGSALIALAAVQHEDLSLKNDINLDVGAGGRFHSGKNLPTWVPDWRIYQSFLLSEPINSHRAHGGTTAKLDIDHSHRILRIHGVWFDTVDKCSRPLEPKAFIPARAREHTELTLKYLWQDVCGQNQFNLHTDYPKSEESLFALMQTLSNGCVQIAGRERKPYHDIPKTRWLEQHAMYLKNNANEPHAIDAEILQLAENAMRKHSVEEWSRAANGASKNRKFAITKKGYYALAPKAVEEGDEICVLFGGKTPFCLRRCKDQYLLVGECYVHGLMDGEAINMLHEGILNDQMFEII